ncbi:CRE-NHR-129 protein [Caenorhabditis remanei]|uniref:CRE-NHR-129 protein n=1 Tax=Caenorhabditis remanei TaxID=31234 RepID=E3LP75_CAERE|nr:CRE-NHR-129 protein [Caenorhabditis remanei]
MDDTRCSTSSENTIELPEILTPKATRSAQRPTKCLICGGVAAGFHYDVPSCNGCKAYFRRYIISDRNLKCKNKQDCFDLTIREKPIKCRPCRYKKCLDVGMNPLALEVDDKQADAGNFKKVTKRIKDQEENEEKEESGQSKQLVIQKIESMHEKIQKITDMLTYLESKLEQFQLSAYNPNWVDIQGIEYLLRSANRISLADRYGPMPGWPLSNDEYTSLPPSVIPVVRKGPPPYSPDKKHWLYFNLITNIEYAKTFMFFHKLNSRDQFILTKYVTLACLNLHVSYASVARKFDCRIQPDGLKQPVRDEDHYSNSVMSIIPLIRYEVQATEYVLLKAICLCNPAVPDLSEHAVVLLAKERQVFAEALFDHCLRNRTNGPSHFSDLIGIIDVLERQQRMQKDLHLLHIAPLVAKAPKEFKIQVIEDIMDS